VHGVRHAQNERKTAMSTKMEDKSWFPGDNHFVASDESGHRGEGNSPESAQDRLEQAQEQGVEWVADLATGPKVG